MPSQYQKYLNSLVHISRNLIGDSTVVIGTSDFELVFADEKSGRQNISHFQGRGGKEKGGKKSVMKKST